MRGVGKMCILNGKLTISETVRDRAVDMKYHFWITAGVNHFQLPSQWEAPPTFGTPWYLYMCPAIVRLGNPNPKLHYSRALGAELGLLLAAFSTLALNN